MTYSITDLSERFDLPASTIRYYEKIGLLEIADRSICMDEDIAKVLRDFNSAKCKIRVIIELNSY